MIARLRVPTPYVLTAPIGAELPAFETELDGYKTRFMAPETSEFLAQDNESAVTIDGAATVGRDVIRIDFIKDSFDRAVATECDPSYAMIRQVLDSYTVRLRHVTHGAQILPVPFPMSNWRLDYLNDDESELQRQDGFVRGRWARQRSFSFIALTENIWKTVHSLPLDYAQQPWEPLLLDALIQGTAPGNAVVLSHTALEVFVAHVLDQLAGARARPQELWDWVTHRSNYQKEPSVEEQFDSLLHALSGHSLKEDLELWESFKILKRARNSFVHEGIIRLGKSSVAENERLALQAAGSAGRIITKVRGWLPREIQWPEYTNRERINMVHTFPPFGPSQGRKSGTG
jgi:hypothetical protein